MTDRAVAVGRDRVRVMVFSFKEPARAVLGADRMLSCCMTIILRTPDEKAMRDR
ncbi:hypothetical protein GCM10010467_16650 [Actinocorallia glomerata]|uniref:Uncharacterized protein n=2 Tax=Actinomycetes TaxID=1760 RepID=A0ABP6LQZ7_9MICC